MNHRVYVLLDIVDGSVEEVTGVLRENLGVLIADALESPPDVIVLIEAPQREQLAKWTIKALSSVETLSEQVRLLPTRDGSNSIVTKLRPSR